MQETNETYSEQYQWNQDPRKEPVTVGILKNQIKPNHTKKTCPRECSGPNETTGKNLKREKLLFYIINISENQGCARFTASENKIETRSPKENKGEFDPRIVSARPPGLEDDTKTNV